MQDYRLGDLKLASGLTSHKVVGVIVPKNNSFLYWQNCRNIHKLFDGYEFGNVRRIWNNCLFVFPLKNSINESSWFRRL